MSNIQDTDLFVIQRPAGSTQGTYKVQAQELHEYVGENTPPPIDFKGTRDFTEPNDDPLTGDPAHTFTPKAGDMLVNGALAPGNWIWTSVDPVSAGTEVNPGDRCLWNADQNYWELVPGGGGGGQVIELDGTYPITIDDDTNGTPAEPIIEIQPAKRTDDTTPVDMADLSDQGGAVIGLATEADVAGVAAGSPSQNPYAVVTADLLKATNDEIASITDPTNGFVSSVSKGTTGSGNDALTINPTKGDVVVDLNGIDTNSPDVPGVITPNEIITIIGGEISDGNLVASVEEGDLTASDVFSHSALKIDPTAGEVKINVKDKVLVPYDFDTHLVTLPAANP